MIKGLVDYEKDVKKQQIKTKHCNIEINTAYVNNMYAVSIDYITRMHGIGTPIGTWSHWYYTENVALMHEAENAIERLKKMSLRDTTLSKDNEEIIQQLKKFIKPEQLELF